MQTTRNGYSRQPIMHNDEIVDTHFPVTHSQNTGKTKHGGNNATKLTHYQDNTELLNNTI